MGFFSKSKKKDTAKSNEGSYRPPDIEENSDSSDDDMVVLDFSSEGADISKSQIKEKMDSKASKTKGKSVAKTSTSVSQKDKSSDSKVATVEEKSGTNTLKSVRDENVEDLSTGSTNSDEFVKVSGTDVPASKPKDLEKASKTKESNDNNGDNAYDAPYIGSKMETEWETVSESGSVHFKNEVLEQLRSRAEDGPLVVRILIVLAVIGVFATSIVVMFIQKEYVLGMFSQTVISGCTFTLGGIILISELRPPFVSGDPKSRLTQLHNFVTRHLSVLHLVWGRGVFCTLMGSLHLGHMNMLTSISGGTLALIGIFAFAIGFGPYMKIESARHSLDDSALYLEFTKYDEDKDGYIDVDGFTRMMVDLDLDLDTCQTIREFQSMDKDQKGNISFQDFKKWRVEEAWSFERAGCMV